MATRFRPKIIPQEQSIKKPFYIGVGSLFLTLILIVVFWSRIPPQVPLFYSKPWGEPQLAANFLLGLPLLLSLLLLITNSLVAQLLSDYVFIRKVLIFGAMIACLLASITVIRIILLII